MQVGLFEFDLVMNNIRDQMLQLLRSCNNLFVNSNLYFLKFPTGILKWFSLSRCRPIFMWKCCCINRFVVVAVIVIAVVCSGVAGIMIIIVIIITTRTPPN